MDYRLTILTSTGYVAVKNLKRQTVIHPADGIKEIQLPRSHKIALWSCSSAGDINAETGLVKLEGKLLRLYCSNNKLQELDIKSLRDLQELDCSNNCLTELDLSEISSYNPAGLPFLKTLNCSNNKLKSLRLGKNLKSLENLDCSKNQLPIIDLAGLVALQVLNAKCNHFGCETPS